MSKLSPAICLRLELSLSLLHTHGTNSILFFLMNTYMEQTHVDEPV
jgi:hypothetical protein